MLMSYTCHNHMSSLIQECVLLMVLLFVYGYSSIFHYTLPRRPSPHCISGPECQNGTGCERNEENSSYGKFFILGDSKNFAFDSCRKLIFSSQLNGRGVFKIYQRIQLSRTLAKNLFGRSFIFIVILLKALSPSARYFNIFGGFNMKLVFGKV